MQHLVFIGLYLFTQASFAQPVVFSEWYIKNALDNNPPTAQEIEASFLGVKQVEMANRDAYSWRLDGKGEVGKSDARLLSNFDGGVVTRASQFSLDIVKPTQYGIDLSVGAFGQKTSNAFISDAATAGVSVGLSMDLYQNFLGRSTNSELRRSSLAVQRAKLEKGINLKVFKSNLRKLYWALVANNEQQRLLSSLVDSAYHQYQEATRRQKAAVADSGEVARYRSQWTTRKASHLSLQYRRGEIVKSIKRLLPELNGKEVILPEYSVDNTIQEVLACSSMISYYKTAPLQFTAYDEIVNLLNQEESLEKKIANTYNDPSVELYGEYSNVGRDFGYGAARDNYNDDGRSTRTVGLKVSIPFGGSKTDTKDVKVLLARNKYKAQARGTISQIRSFHAETAKIINILQDVVRNQKETNKYLDKSLKVSRRKYKQARISVQELISEQDSHLQSRLSEIDTNLTIINTLMDYFSIYTEMPCKLNKV